MKSAYPAKKAQPAASVISSPATPTPVKVSDPATLPSMPTSAKLHLDRQSDGVHAEGVLIDEKRIRVLSGSIVSRKNNLPNQAKQANNDALRKQLESDGTIIERKFTRDWIFTSTSMAATIILGSSTSGNAAWKTVDGTTLGEVLKAGVTLTPKKMHLTDRGSEAYGFAADNNEFIVLAGSKVSADTVESLKSKPGAYNLRLDLEKTGGIKNGVLVADTVFSSPSMAACVISGASVSGADWKEE